jgi:hypothetical protein
VSMRTIQCAVMLLVVSFGEALASTVEFLPFTCPLDSTTFEARIQSSYFLSGQMLDLEPLGAIIAPSPLPVCPRDHFVIYADSIPAAELAVLKPFVLSPEFQDQANNNSPYFLLATMFERLDAEPSTIGYMYLQASWEVAGDPGKHREYIKKSLAALLSADAGQGLEEGDSLGLEILRAELERQLGAFPQAHARLQRVLAAREPPGDLARIAQYEIDLIAQQDSLRHERPK